MKLTANERYLLEIIMYLRGNAYDAWGRLNAIRSGKETARAAAPKTELKQLHDELAGALHFDHTGAHGAHLPHPNDPHFSDELKHKLIERHRHAVQAGRRVKNVYDLVKKRELAGVQRAHERVSRRIARQNQKAR